MDLPHAALKSRFSCRNSDKEFDAILLSPPCSSFSSATWPNNCGPLIATGPQPDLAWEVAERVAEGAVSFGRAARGGRPASMWHCSRLGRWLSS